jgi:acyl-CoA dehydrogenase
MTAATEGATELSALRELADDIFDAATEPALDVQQPGLPYDSALWSTLAASGLTLLTTPESLGGSGAGLLELSVVLDSAGFHAAPVPIAENDLLASWLLRTAELPIDQGPMTAVLSKQALDGRHLSATCERVPWASNASVVVVAGPDYVAALRPDQITVRPDSDIAGQAYGRVSIDAELDADQLRTVEAGLAEEFILRGALARAIQTCGSLSRALELSCAHVTQREQFGRPIARFQAVQALISDAAGKLAMAKTAAAFAGDIAANQGFDSAAARFAVAVAKIESARAATTVTRPPPPAFHRARTGVALGIRNPAPLATDPRANGPGFRQNRVGAGHRTELELFASAR